MSKFKDAEGREWHLRLNHSLLRRIRDAGGYDLHSMDGQSTALQKMADDPLDFIATLYQIVEDQAERRSVTVEAFGEGFTDETVELAAKALVEAIANFTRPLRRELVRTALTMPTGAMEAATATVHQIMRKTLSEAQEKLQTCGA